jgi:hypothetical protein
MKSMKKIVLVTMCVLFVVSVINIQEAGAKDKCYKFYYNWGCIGQDDYDYKNWSYVYYKLKDDGTFYYPEGLAGYWYIWKGSIFLRHLSGCQRMASGKKNQGFMICTDGSTPMSGNYAGCWYMQKTKCTMFDSE